MSLAKYPPETASILHRDIFCFFLKDEEFVSKTINDSNIDPEKFPASKVRQIAKKMESSKSTARHIKAVASDPQVAQVNLMRHQRTDVPPCKSKWKQHSHKQRSRSPKRYSNEHKNQRPPFKKFDPSQAHKRRDRCSKCGDSKHVEGSSVLPGSSSARPVTNMVILPACATKSNHLSSKEIPRHTSCTWE